MRKSGNIDYILLETTGLADPYPIINSFWADEALECLAYLDGTVCLVDAKNIDGQLREWQVLKQQIVLADVILINKTDLVSEMDLESLRERLREMNPLAKVLECQYGQVEDLTRLLDLKAYGAVDCSFAQHQRGYLDLMATLNVQSSVARDHREVRSLRLTTSKPVNRDNFERWLFTTLWTETDKFKILRVKGLLSVKDANRDILIQAVQELYEITELTTHVIGRESVLIFLGRFEDEEAVEVIKESFYSSIY